MKVIDVSGFGHSGKTAVTDLLREVEGVHAHPHSFEFGLLRLPDGIMDLAHALTDKTWSPSRSDRAIKRFLRLCQVFQATYKNFLEIDLQELSLAYIDEITEEKISVHGWYDSLYECPRFNLAKELARSIGLLGLYRKVKKPASKLNISKKPYEDVYLSSGFNFLEATKAFLEKVLFNSIFSEKSALLLNNAFEPFSPLESLKYFDHASCIIVRRDPRDIYASVKLYEESFIPPFEKENSRYSLQFLLNLKRDMLGLDDLKKFISRQKLYHSKTNSSLGNEKVLLVDYEDLVIHYKETTSRIFDFLEIPTSSHRDKLNFFDPRNSKQNVGIWRKLDDRDTISVLEANLADQLYDL